MRWQRLPALTDAERDALIAAAERVKQRFPKGHGRTRELDELARTYGVTLRTLQRYERRAA